MNGRGQLRNGERLTEAQLLRNASRAHAAARDPELSRILSLVATRRRARVQGLVGGGRQALHSPEPQTTPRVQSVHARAGTVLESVRVSDDIRILRVARPEGFEFRPGQHLKVGLLGDGNNPYTIASAPHQPYLEFCIERVFKGKVSPRLSNLAPGQRVTLGPRAKGSFTLVDGAKLHLMVATVTGIAPFRSIVADAAHRRAWPGKVIVLHGASYADELVYRAELEALAQRFPQWLRYLPTVSRPQAARNRGWNGAVGRVDELARRIASQLDRGGGHGVQVYACGNAGMIANVRRSMAALAFPVATEAFD